MEVLIINQAYKNIVGLSDQNDGTQWCGRVM